MGNCAAGGYLDGSTNNQAFVVSERDGRWRKAIEVPGTGALNKGGIAQVVAMSCPSAGNCAAGGPLAGSGHDHAFVVSERDGHWRQAIEVPGSGALDTGGSARPQLGVVPLGWQLRRGRGLHGRRRSRPGIRRQPDLRNAPA